MSSSNHQNPTPHSTPPFTHQPPIDQDILLFQALTINDSKSSVYQSSNLQSSEVSFCDQEHDFLKKGSLRVRRSRVVIKNKNIGKTQKETQILKNIHTSRKRRIGYLQKKVEELQKQISSLRREQNHCPNCRYNWSQYCPNRIQEIIQPEQFEVNVAGLYEQKKHSRDSLQFQKFDFNTPLLHTQEMEEKMWIFLGTMLIAMGSKVTDFDGTFNVFKIMKESVDNIRRQVQKCETKLNLDFFCMKEQFNEPSSGIDGVDFDPFYSGKEAAGVGAFTLEGIKLECVEAYELLYENKYNFCIKYDSLLTIMEYAREHCSIS